MLPAYDIDSVKHKNREFFPVSSNSFRIRFSRGSASLAHIFTVAAGAATVAATIISAVQLYQINSGQRIDRANAALMTFTMSKDIKELSDQIAGATDRGRDYSTLVSDPKTVKVLEHYLNSLELIAGNVLSGHYDEAAIRRQLARTIYKQVHAHLRGLNDSTPSGNWSGAHSLFPSDTYPDLRHLYEKWFPDGKYVEPKS